MMVDKPPAEFLKTPKNINDMHDYLFELHLGSEVVQFRHEILGIPLLPHIGKYYQTGYEFSQALGLITITLNLSSDGKEFLLKDENKKSSYSIGKNLEILKKFIDIPFDIPENTKVEDNSDTSNQNKKQKYKEYSNYQGKHNQHQNNNYKQKNYSKGEFGVSEQLVMRVVFVNSSALNLIKKDKFLATEGYDVYNVVPHPFLFQEIVLDDKKRKGSKFTPMSIFRDQDSISVQRHDSSKNKAKHDYGVNFGGFRYEISNLHMRGDSLCFSPNNLRFHLNEVEDVSDFWLGILGEYRIANHLFYIISANSDQASSNISQALKAANTLEELLEKLEIFFKGQRFLSNLKLIVNQ